MGQKIPVLGKDPELGAQEGSDQGTHTMQSGNQYKGLWQKQAGRV